MSIREEIIQNYLHGNRSSADPIQTAGYWLYHAEHDPLGEFDRMVEMTDSEDSSYYKEVRDIIINALNA